MALKLNSLAYHFGKQAPVLVGRKIAELVCGMATFAILARELSPENFAIYTLILGLISFVRLTSLPGIGNALAQSFARGHKGDFRRAVLLSAKTSLLGMLALAAAAWWHMHTGDNTMAAGLLAASIGFPLYSGFLYWRNTLVGDEKYWRLLFFDGASFTLRTITVSACAFTFPQYIFPTILIALLAPGLVNIFATLWQTRQIPKSSTREPNALRYGVKVSMYEIPSLAVQQLDRIALFYFISPEALAVYSVAVRIPQLLQAMIGEAIAVLGPVFARRENYDQSLHRFTFIITATLLFGCFLFSLIAIPYILPLLSGPKYNDSIFYAQILTTGIATGTIGQIYFRYVKSKLDSKAFLQITLSQAAIDGPTILLLTFYFGIKGAVAAFILKGATISLITGFIVYRKYHLKSSSVCKEK
ncbi:lipopolysaccharide biosynthesis protein [Thalassospira sp. TSL5-1]|uniref:lipopolysaccharide biosynthesis protein n=1 Tax=Thalassospira sp. TSL5-1 TaxID=1544451 RepID=UPI00093CF324|nr:oligosaccharide flippase family protein [Thalassospira sp. TSL5-1]OKH87452.1 hypothetical protein LF95_11645 [Thalassospira sp. TSL5-1]